MVKNSLFSSTRTRRLGILVAISSIVLLAAACGSSLPTTAAPVVAPLNPAPTAVSAVAPTQDLPTALPPATNPDACTLLTQDDVSQVLGTPVDTAVSSGLGGMCTYTSRNLKIDFIIAGHTGGAKAMNTVFASLGDLALVIPGLGDQAFFNTNPDLGNPLFLLKGDAEYNFSMSDTTYQPLDQAVVQATEKALAVALLHKLQ